MAKFSNHTVKPPLPFLDFCYHRGVIHRDDPPGFRGRVNLAAPRSEAFYRLACIFFIGDKKEPTRHSGPKLDCPIREHALKALLWFVFWGYPEPLL